MNCKKITNAFELISKICGVMIAASIVLSTAATNVLFPAAALFGLAAGNWRVKAYQIIHNPVAVVFLLFYTLLLVGTVYSTAPWPDILLMLRKYDKVLFAALFFHLFTEERWRNYSINAYIAAVFVMLIASYLRIWGWLPYGAMNGIVEVFKYSIEFNFLMAFAAYFVLLKSAADRRCYRWLWVIFLLFVIYTILFRSIGRSGYYVFVSLWVLFFFQKLRWHGLLIGIISMMLLFSLAFHFSPTFKGRNKEAYSDVKVYRQNDNTSVGLRISFLKNSIALVKAHPIIGTGTGSFAHEYAKITSPPTHNPHNEYAYIATQFGALGLMLLLLLFGIPLWYSQFLSEEPKYIARGAVIAIMVGCLANSWLLDTTQGHFYVYFIALAFAALPIKRIQNTAQA